MGTKRIITLKLTQQEAEGLMYAGNRGVADLHDAQGDADLESADWADKALDKLGDAMNSAWPDVRSPS